MDSGLTIAMNGQAALEKWVAYQFENLHLNYAQRDPVKPHLTRGY